MYKHKKIVWVLLCPGLIGVCIFYVIPFCGGLVHSFTDGSFTPQFVGFANFSRILKNPIFQLGIKNTWFFSLICAPTVWFLSFLLASTLNRIKIPINLFRSILLLPYLLPTSSIIPIWTFAYDYGGTINRLLSFCGIDRILWLEDTTSRIPIVSLYIWKNTGFSVTIFIAALSSIDRIYFDYALLEGASWWKQTFSISLPLIAPTAFLVFILAWINSFKSFKETYLLSGHYPDPSIYSLQHYLNNKFMQMEYLDVTTAAYLFAIGVLLLFAILFLISSYQTCDS